MIAFSLITNEKGAIEGDTIPFNERLCSLIYNIVYRYTIYVNAFLHAPQEAGLSVLTEIPVITALIIVIDFILVFIVIEHRLGVFVIEIQDIIFVTVPDLLFIIIQPAVIQITVAVAVIIITIIIISVLA